MRSLREGMRCALWCVFGLVTLAQAGERMRVIAEQAEVKLGSKILKTLPKGAEIEAITRNGAWVGVQVDVDGELKAAWIHERNLEALVAHGLKITIQAAGGPKEVEIPDLVAFGRIKGVKEVTARVQQMLIQISPLLGAFVTPEIIGENMGWENLAGLDRDRPLAFLVMDPKKFPVPPLLLLPVADAEAFKNAPMENSVKVGTYVLAGENAALIEEVSPRLQELQGIPVDGMTGDVHVRINLPLILQSSDAAIENGIQMLKGIAAMAQQAQGAGAESSEMTMAILEGEIRWLLGLAKETQELSLAAAANPDGPRFTLTVSAKPGTKLATAFQSAPAPKHRLASLLPPEEALFALTTDLGSAGWSALMQDFTQKVFSNAKFADEETKKMCDLSLKLYGGFDGQCAVSCAIRAEGIAVSQGIGFTSDSAANRQAIREILGLFAKSQFGKMYEQMGMSFEMKSQTAARKKNGIEIDAVTGALKLAEGAEENAMAKQQVELARKIYGDPIRVEMAFHERVLLASVGQGAAADLDALLDKAGQGSGTLPKDLQTAQGLFEKGGHVYGTMSLGQIVRMVEMVGGIMNPKFAQGGNPPAIMGPPVAFCGRCRGNNLDLTLYIPTAPLASLQAYIMGKIMQQGGGQPRQGGGDEGAAPPAF